MSVKDEDRKRESRGPSGVPGLGIPLEPSLLLKEWQCLSVVS